MNPKADWYFEKAGKWKPAIIQLRTIITDYGLNEEVKWGVPCYTFDKSNIVLIHVFKEYCALLFFKGALLQDTYDMLVQQTKNVQAARQIRFTHAKDIIEKEAEIKDYIHQAIEVEKAGLKVQLKKTEEYTVPEEFQTKLEKMPVLKTAFESLTPGRQRAYLFYFTQAKQSQTREARIEKCMLQIMNGKGLND